MSSPADQDNPDERLDTAWQPASAAERIYSAAEWASTDNCSDPTHHRVLSALTDKHHQHMTSCRHSKSFITHLQPEMQLLNTDRNDDDEVQ